LAQLGAVVLDADQIAREMVAVGSPGLERVIAHFGRGVLCRDGALDRERLAAIVFADAAERRALEEIVHPLVRERMAARIATACSVGDAPLIVAEIPLLFETGRAGEYPLLLVVDCPLALRIERLGAQRGMSVAAARARIDAQLPLEEKVRQATCVIDNSGNLDALRREARRVWSECLTLPLPEGRR
jgi:dephospho-CoA kinase